MKYFKVVLALYAKVLVTVLLALTFSTKSSATA